MRGVVADVVEMVRAVVVLAVGGPDAGAVAGIPAVLVGVVQVHADVPVHGRETVGHHQAEVVLATGLDRRGRAFVGEVVEDVLHGLAQGGPGVGRDAQDDGLDGPGILVDGADDVGAVVAVEHGDTDAQLLGNIHDVVEHGFQDLDARVVGNGRPLRVGGVEVDPVEVVAAVAAVLAVVRFHQESRRFIGPFAVEITGFTYTRLVNVVGPAVVEHAVPLDVPVVVVVGDGRVHGSRVVRQDHHVGAARRLLDEEGHLALFLGRRRPGRYHDNQGDQ